MSKKIKKFDPSGYQDLFQYIEALREFKFNEGYTPIHKELFSYNQLTDLQKQKFLKKIVHPDMLRAKTLGEWNWVIEEPIHEVYCFPFLTSEFCDMLIEESEHHDCYLSESDGPNGPDEYPTTDVRLATFPGDTIDHKPLNDLYVDLLREFIYPIIQHVWKYRVKTWQWPFLARYKQAEQPFLDFHHDNCTCALVVALNEENKDYKGGGTFFERQRWTDTKPKGYATLHPSRLTHRHGAKRVTEGTRYVLNTFID